jgi:UDP-N-acetylmuramoyl-tripeptide--D-alanyl-D-alanine ligase
MFKKFVQKRLELYVKRYFRKHSEVKLVVVTGSVGKTSTKVAIANLLTEKYRVRLHWGEYNDLISSPVAILGLTYPKNIRSPIEWLAVFRAAKQRINKPTDVDIIIQELGSDRIGEVIHFGTYLKPDIAVITAVSAEHMEFFHTIDKVAEEELGVANYSKSAIINKDDIEGKYAKYLNNEYINTYGTSASAEYHYIVENYSSDEGYEGSFFAPEFTKPVKASIDVVGEHNIRPAIAAAAVGVKLGLNEAEIKNGLSKISSINGRMKKLRGVRDTTIIDDSYNSSPLAAQSALRALYQIPASMRVAVLGDMNELGETSAVEHEEIGKMCDPNQLSWVVTVGEQSGKYLAAAARSKGCQVKSFKDALSAGAFVNSVIQPGAVILFKGSQNGIFLEEAVKVVLHSTDDESKLVRQSPEWLEKKRKFFESIS